MPVQLGHHSMTWDGYFNKNKLAFNLDRVLREVAAAGYTHIELGGDARRLGPAGELLSKVTDAGLTIAAWGTAVTYNPWPPNTEEYRREMDYAAELGVTVLAVCGGFMAEQRRNTFAHDYKIFADNMAAAMQHAGLNGQIIAFHPHRGCIVETNEEVAQLMEFLPHMQLCVDTGHSISVLSDPVELIYSYPDHIAHVHLKDWNPETRKFAEIGYGTAGLDFVRVFNALDEIGYAGAVIVERDDPQVEASESARLSYDFLTRHVLEEGEE